jgi:hypothetical protein
MITPEILPNNSTGVTSTLPKPVEPYMAPTPQKKGLDQPAPAFRGNQTSVTTPAVPVASAVPAPTAVSPSAKDAAATMTNLTKNTRTVVNGDAAKPANETTPAAARPMTDSEKKALARAQKLERERLEAEAKTQAAEDAKNAKEAQARAARQGELDRQRLEADKKQAALDKELQEKAAKEQAKRDEAEKKRQAELAKKQSASSQKAQ